MFENLRARADSRALFGAVAFGSAMGVVLGVAYLAGGATRAAVDHAQAVRLAESARTSVSLTPSAPADAQADTPVQLAGAAPELRPALPATAAELKFRVAEAKRAKSRHDLDCLTDAVYYEARGESDAGQEAVAQVVLNRVRSPRFPRTICAVVYQGLDTGQCQFSFACDGAMRRAREPEAWRHARGVAARALGGFVMQEVGNATHFHVAGIGGVWGAGLMRVAQVGAHVFYRLSGHGVTQLAAHTPSQSDAPSAVAASRNETPSTPELILASAVSTPAQAAEPAKPAPAPKKEAAADQSKPAQPAQKEAAPAAEAPAPNAAS